MKTIRLTEGSTFELQVCHPNGETKWLPVEAYAERWICVRWGMAGQYDVMLKDGRVIARSAKARSKNPINLWHAVNKLECREWVAERMGITKEENEERYKLHHERMPGTKRANISGAHKNHASGERNR